MSSYPPPNPVPLPSIFNDIYFSDYNSTLTIRVSDFRYVNKLGDTMVGQLKLNSSLLPALCFSLDSTSGLYYSAFNEIAFCTNSNQRFRITNTFSQFLNSELRVTHTQSLADPKFTLYANRVSGGQICQSTITQKSVNASDKSLTFRNNTADLSATDTTYRFQMTGTTEEIQINQRGQLLLAVGTTSNPALSFAGVEDAGFNFVSNALFLSTGGVERQRWSNANGIKFSVNGTNFRNIQFGSITYNTSLSAGTALEIGPFSFPASFGSTPFVFLQPRPQSGSAWWDRVWYTVISISTTNFTIQIANSAASPTSALPGVVIQWFAIGG